MNDPTERGNLVVPVAIHTSQWPGRVADDLLESLRSRQVNHKFHYDTYKQTSKWLALHQEYSPSRTEPDCAAIYDHAFAAAARRIEAKRVRLIGLGCGGGQKDSRLLRLLIESGKSVSYTPCDVSVAMVLEARSAAMAVFPDLECEPLVCDLAATSDLPQTLAVRPHDDAQRLVTFFGLIPNFEPRHILPRLAELLQPGDGLLFSANLAPGADYDAGVRHILPQYDNAPTRDWLMTFLLDLGVTPADGLLRFGIEQDESSGLKRVAAQFHFQRPVRIEALGESFDFKPGESILLFF